MQLVFLAICLFFFFPHLFLDIILMYFVLPFSVSITFPPCVIVFPFSSTCFPIQHLLLLFSFPAASQPFPHYSISLCRLIRARITTHVYNFSPYPIHPSFTKNGSNQMQSVHPPKSLNLVEVSPLE